MAGYLKTAARKAAIKRWQAAGARARRRASGSYSETAVMKAHARRNKIYETSATKLLSLASSSPSGSRKTKLMRALKGTMRRANLRLGYKRRK